jgi:hypothetical protein
MPSSRMSAVRTDRRVVAAGALATFTSGERAKMPVVRRLVFRICLSVHGIALRKSPASVFTAHAERKIRSQTMREKCAINSTAVTPI